MGGFQVSTGETFENPAVIPNISLRLLGLSSLLRCFY